MRKYICDACKKEIGKRNHRVTLSNYRTKEDEEIKRFVEDRQFCDNYCFLSWVTVNQDGT